MSRVASFSLALHVKCVILSLATCLVAKAQDTAYRITPEAIGLPKENRRTASPWEVRVYPRDKNGKVTRKDLSSYPKKYPITVDSLPDKQYSLSKDEGAAYHGGIDFSSQVNGQRTKVDFKAGIYGTVLRANGKDGTVFVQTPSGNVIQYLHASGVSVKAGQKVTPETVLGKTGSTGTGEIHLHIQATDGKRLIDADEAFQEARTSVPADLWKPVNWKMANWVNAELPEPPVENGVVKATGKITYDSIPPANTVPGNNSPPPSVAGPPARTIFERVSPVLKRLQEEGRLKEISPKVIEKLEAVEKLKDRATEDVKTPDDIDRAIEVAEATLEKSDAERELKQAKEELSKQTASLDKEKERIDADKAQLGRQEAETENERKELQQQKFSRGVQRNGLIQMGIVLKSQDDTLRREEKTIADLVAAALKKIDYSKYHECPNKPPQPWDTCGHGDIKTKWLNAQLAAILGPAVVERLKRAKQQRDDLNKQLKELDDKEKAIQEQDNKTNERIEQIEAQAISLSKERDSLLVREKQLASELKQAKSQSKDKIDELTKRISDLDETIKDDAEPDK